MNEQYFTLNRIPKTETIRHLLLSELSNERSNLFSIQTLDITKAETECIVNAANPSLLGGGGVDGAIHRAAGSDLLRECRTLHGCKTGEAKLTKGYQLKAAYVIHTVGPVYSGTPDDAKLLRNCYWNSLELARTHGIHSIAFPSISTGAYRYPKKEAAAIAAATVAAWLRVNPDYGMSILFACYDEATTSLYREAWERLMSEPPQQIPACELSHQLEKAIVFATECHKGAVRKGTDLPYILHPLETLQILFSMNADPELMMAGVLHDTVEDTAATLLDLYSAFGADVAALVNAHTDVMRDDWVAEKLESIHRVSCGDVRVKKLVMADSVANLRNMALDYSRMGDKLWEKFSVSKEHKAWYYSSLLDEMIALQADPDASHVYWEMNALFKDLFVTFHYDPVGERLYQRSVTGEQYTAAKTDPLWSILSGEIPNETQTICRHTAERIIENWQDAVPNENSRLPT